MTKNELESMKYKELLDLLDTFREKNKETGKTIEVYIRLT